MTNTTETNSNNRNSATLRNAAKVFGWAFLAIGILGFIPGVTRDGHMLLGIFHINAFHNIVHLLSGAVALWAGMTSARASRTYFQIFGIVYGLVAVLGFIYGDRHIFGFLANNIADAWLHVLIAATSLYFGFVYESAESREAAADSARPVAPRH